MSSPKALHRLSPEVNMGALGERLLAVSTELNHKVFHNSVSVDCVTEQLLFASNTESTSLLPHMFICFAANTKEFKCPDES